MNAVRVVVLTTNGPAAVERITEEDPEVSSVICLSGKAVALPVSGAYDAFVREPTGVVQHHFGHRAYRVDVDAMIAEGYSWQLGVLAAHALDAAGRLAGKGEAADRVIWLTGEVDRDLDVLAVDHLTDKLDRAAEARIGEPDARAPLSIYVPAPNREDIDEAWLAGKGEAADRVIWLTGEVDRDLDVLAVDHLTDKLDRAAEARIGEPDARAPLSIYVPAPNREDIDEAWLAGRGLAPDTCRLVAVGTVNEVLNDLGLDTLAARKSTAVPAAARTRRQPLAWGAGAVVAVAIAALVFLSSAVGDLKNLAELDASLESSADAGHARRLQAKLFEAYLDWSRPAVGSLTVELFEHRPPGGGSCAQVRFGRLDAVLKPLRAQEGHFQASPSDGLCGLRLGVRAAGDDVHLLALSQTWSGGRQIGGGRADAHSRSAVVLGDLSLDMDPPRRARRPLAYHYTVFAAAGSLDGVEAWWERHVLRPGVAPGSGAWFTAAERLAGVTVVGRRHRVTR